MKTFTDIMQVKRILKSLTVICCDVFIPGVDRECPSARPGLLVPVSDSI